MNAASRRRKVNATHWILAAAVALGVVAGLVYRHAQHSGTRTMQHSALLIALLVVASASCLLVLAGSKPRWIVESSFDEGDVHHPVGEWWNGLGAPKDGLKDAADAKHYRRLFGFSYLWIGLDGRWSTSKTSMLAWTYVIVWALLVLVIADSLGVTGPDGKTGLIDSLALQDNYLLLLGGPFAAAVLAKGITSSAAANGDAKPSGTPDPTQLTSDDQGQTDIGDFQYVAFNLVALAFFLVRFIPKVNAGLPAMPDSLVGLTSLSALTYVGKKAVTSQTPVITDVEPGTVHEGALPADGVTIYGQYLGSAQTRPDVRVGTSTNLAKDVTIAAWGATGIRITVPHDSIADQFGKGTTSVEVRVFPPGATSAVSAKIVVTKPAA